MNISPIKLIIASVTLVTLQGCAALGGGGPDASKLASADWSNMSCSEIDAVFAEYRQSVEDAQSYTGLLGMVSPEAQSATGEAASAAMQAYHSAKESAKPVLMAKGCTDVEI